MIRIEKTFKTGHIRPFSRGILLDNDEGKIYLDDLIEEAVGENYSYSGGSELLNIKIIIEIEEARKA